MTIPIAQKVQQIIESAERTHLYGEVTLRFRDGHLVFVTETRTTPAETMEDGTREQRSSKR